MTGTLNKNQITLTSVWKEKYDRFGNGAILLNSESGWRPETNGVQEHIKVKYKDLFKVSELNSGGFW